MTKCKGGNCLKDCDDCLKKHTLTKQKKRREKALLKKEILSKMIGVLPPRDRFSRTESLKTVPIRNFAWADYLPKTQKIYKPSISNNVVELALLAFLKQNTIRQGRDLVGTSKEQGAQTYNLAPDALADLPANFSNHLHLAPAEEADLPSIFHRQDAQQGLSHQQDAGVGDAGFDDEYLAEELDDYGIPPEPPLFPTVPPLNLGSIAQEPTYSFEEILNRTPEQGTHRQDAGFGDAVPEEEEDAGFGYAAPELQRQPDYENDDYPDEEALVFTEEYGEEAPVEPYPEEGAETFRANLYRAQQINPYTKSQETPLTAMSRARFRERLILSTQEEDAKKLGNLKLPNIVPEKEQESINESLKLAGVKSKVVIKSKAAAEAEAEPKTQEQIEKAQSKKERAAAKKQARAVEEQLAIDQGEPLEKETLIEKRARLARAKADKEKAEAEAPRQRSIFEFAGAESFEVPAASSVIIQEGVLDPLAKGELLPKR